MRESGNFYKRLKKKNKIFGFLLTILLSIVILFIFFGELVKSSNSRYFGMSGDGFRSYYNAIYHVKYDETYSHFQGMNYPYGEHVMFADTQPALSFSMKFISDNIVDISDNVVGVINSFMILSIIIGAVFLYLVLGELGINRYYSSLVAIGLVFLSPQLARFAGHYSLSFLFIIPVILYLLIRFYKQPSYKKSLIICIYLLFIGSFHLYNYTFVISVLIFFWIIQLFTVKGYRKIKFFSINVLIQVVMPFVILNLFLFLTDNITDRTDYPWGFLAYKSSWEGIFLNKAQLSWPWFKELINFSQVEWEGYSYIGHVASFGYIFLFAILAFVPFFHSVNTTLFILVLIVGIIVHIILKRKRRIFSITDNKILNILTWAGFFTLLISFAWPFIFQPKIIPYIGPLKQFRGIGRFAWIFFYTINITIFYVIYNLKIRRKYVKIGIMALSLFILYFDAYSNFKYIPGHLNNRNKYLEDKANVTEVNNWVKKIEVDKYQAIIPVPYFHVGSENLWLDSKCNVAGYAYIVSIKTSLPTTAVVLGRTSISQTIKNVKMFMEPYRKLDILDDFPNRKPFLIVLPECNQINQNEARILDVSKFICKTQDFSLYELPFYQLEILSDSLYSDIESEISFKTLTEFDGLLTVDTVKNFYYKPDTDEVDFNGYVGKGLIKGNIKEFNTIFEDTFPNFKHSEEYVISFWVGNSSKDLFLRSNMEITFCDSTDNIYRVDYSGLNRQTKIIDGDWALIEYNYTKKNKFDRVKFTIWNTELKRGELLIDELLVRPVSNNIYRIIPGKLVKNNRVYIK